jgi:hypothetical protein
MNNELDRIRMEVVVAYFKLISRYTVGETEKNKKISFGIVDVARSICSNHLQNTFK